MFNSGLAGWKVSVVSFRQTLYKTRSKKSQLEADFVHPYGAAPHSILFLFMIDFIFGVGVERKDQLQFCLLFSEMDNNINNNITTFLRPAKGELEWLAAMAMLWGGFTGFIIIVSRRKKKTKLQQMAGMVGGGVCIGWWLGWFVASRWGKCVWWMLCVCVCVTVSLVGIG
jgi:hypothetical protein